MKLNSFVLKLYFILSEHSTISTQFQFLQFIFCMVRLMSGPFDVCKNFFTVSGHTMARCSYQDILRSQNIDENHQVSRKPLCDVRLQIKLTYFSLTKKELMRYICISIQSDVTIRKRNRINLTLTVLAQLAVYSHNTFDTTVQSAILKYVGAFWEYFVLIEVCTTCSYTQAVFLSHRNRQRMRQTLLRKFCL